MAIHIRFETPKGLRLRSKQLVTFGMAAVATREWPDDLPFAHHVLATKLVSAPVEELVFVIAPDNAMLQWVTLRLHVVDGQTGIPLVAKIACHQEGGFSSMTTTDANGVIETLRMLPGRVVLTISADGHEVNRRTLYHREGELTDLGTIRLGAARLIEGRMQDAAGNPVIASFVVRNLERWTTPQALSIGQHSQSDEQGRFEATQLGRGRYVVVATAPKFARKALVVDVASQDIEGLKFTLERGTSVVLVPKDSRASEYLATIRHKGLPLFSERLSGPWLRSLRLAPGRYDVDLARLGEIVRREVLVVGAEPVRMEIAAK